MSDNPRRRISFTLQNFSLGLWLQDKGNNSCQWLFPETMLTGMVTCPPRYRTTRRGPAGISATKQDELDHIDETALAFNAGPSSVDSKLVLLPISALSHTQRQRDKLTLLFVCDFPDIKTGSHLATAPITTA